MDAPAPLFDGASATADAASGIWDLPPPPPPSSANGGTYRGAGQRPDFVVVIPLAGDLSDAGRRYGLTLNSRSTIWKYLLTGDWTRDRPCIVDGSSPASAAFVDPYPRLDQPPQTETLADGRPAIAIRSAAPIPLRDRPDQQFQLWARSDSGAQDHVVIKRLPVPSPQSLAAPDAAHPLTLTSEIFVQR
jgi:hypothetical protein